MLPDWLAQNAVPQMIADRVNTCKTQKITSLVIFNLSTNPRTPANPYRYPLRCFVQLSMPRRLDVISEVGR